MAHATTHPRPHNGFLSTPRPPAHPTTSMPRPSVQSAKYVGQISRTTYRACVCVLWPCDAGRTFYQGLQSCSGWGVGRVRPEWSDQSGLLRGPPGRPTAVGGRRGPRQWARGSLLVSRGTFSSANPTVFSDLTDTARTRSIDALLTRPFFGNFYQALGGINPPRLFVGPADLPAAPAGARSRPSRNRASAPPRSTEVHAPRDALDSLFLLF